MIREASGGVFIDVRVQPGASRNRHSCEGERLKVWVTSPPVEGKANDALVEYLSKVLGVRRSHVSLKAGGKSRNKVVFVEGLRGEEVRERLGC